MKTSREEQVQVVVIKKCFFHSHCLSTPLPHNSLRRAMPVSHHGFRRHRQPRSPAPLPYTSCFHSQPDGISSIDSPPVSYSSSLEQNRGGRAPADLAKVLNGIRRLEERHATNLLLVTALKQELHYARVTIETLLIHRRSDRQKIYTLRKKIGKGNEAEESLRRSLEKKLSCLRSSLSNAARELEQERRSRVMLEDLCDEFARAMKNYSGVVRALKRNSEKNMGDVEEAFLHTSSFMSCSDEGSSCSKSSYLKERRKEKNYSSSYDRGRGHCSASMKNLKKSSSSLRQCTRNEVVDDSGFELKSKGSRTRGSDSMFLKRGDYFSDHEDGGGDYVEASFEEHMWNLSDEMSSSCRLLYLVEGRRWNARAHSFSKSGSDSSEYGP